MIHRISPLAGKKIDPTRMHTWRFPAATVALPESALKSFAPFRKPKLGDVVLTEVVHLGSCDFIEPGNGCNMKIFEGTVILGIF